jgi:MOSC domain-containing protein YiiM
LVASLFRLVSGRRAGADCRAVKNSSDPGRPEGTVASIHLHPKESGQPLSGVESVEAVADQGLVGDLRKFGRFGSDGKPGKRQVTLIAREEIAGHAAALGLMAIAPGRVRSNIETTGLDLMSLVGRQVRVGTAILLFVEGRTPCEQMDEICQGLRERMKDDRQGVLAKVVQSGTIRVGDCIEPI